MTYKFQRLEVYQIALEYLDLMYLLAAASPKTEEYNLKSQIIRAGTSVLVNISEGSTGQSDAEQSRFLGMALRSLIETVACRDIIIRRGYQTGEALQRSAEVGEKLFAKVQALRRTLEPKTIRSAVVGHRS